MGTMLITPQELPKWVPGRELASSAALGWHEVALRSYHYDGLDVQVPPLCDFTIVAYAQGSTPMSRCADGQWRQALCRPGDVSLLTRSQPSHWQWTDPIDVHHVYLGEALVNRVANEVMARSVSEVRLHDELQVQDPMISALVAGIAHEAGTLGLGGALLVEALGLQLAVQLLRRHADLRLRPADDRGRLSAAQMRRVREQIEAQLAEPLTLATLAATAGLGVCTFSRRFRASFGQAPHAWIIGRRVERACTLLADGTLPLKAVAAACGFADQAHMNRVLRAQRGTTPSALRRAAAPAASVQGAARNVQDGAPSGG